MTVKIARPKASATSRAFRGRRKEWATTNIASAAPWAGFPKERQKGARGKRDIVRKRLLTRAGLVVYLYEMDNSAKLAKLSGFSEVEP